MSKIFKSFTEYLDTKGNTQTKAIVSADGDTTEKPAVKPPKAATKGQNWHFPSTGDDMKPYAAPSVGNGKEKGYTGVENGLGNAGDKRLKYEPKTENSKDNPKNGWGNQSFPNQKSSTPWEPNTAAEPNFPKSVYEFVEQRKSELAIEESNNIPTIYAHREGKIIPDPMEAIRYVSYLVNKNNRLMEAFIVECYKQKSLTKIMKMLQLFDEETDAPAADTEGPDEDKERKKLKASKGRRTKSIKGDELDMGNSDVLTTTTKG